METPTIPPLSKIPYFCLSNFPRLFEARQVEAVAELLRSVSLFVSKMEEEPQKKKNNVGLSVIENKALFTFWKVL